MGGMWEGIIRDPAHKLECASSIPWLKKFWVPSGWPGQAAAAWGWCWSNVTEDRSMMNDARLSHQESLTPEKRILCWEIKTWVKICRWTCHSSIKRRRVSFNIRTNPRIFPAGPDPYDNHSPVFINPLPPLWLKSFSPLEFRDCWTGHSAQTLMEPNHCSRPWAKLQ